MQPSPDDTAPPWPDDAVEVGVILDAWGLKGGIKVKPYAADPKALFSSRRWYLQPPSTPRPAAAPTPPVLLKVTSARDQGDLVVATVQESPDRHAAEALRGCRIYVPRSSFPTAADGEYYWVDLIGLSVRNTQDERLGVVADLLDTGAHAVLRVRDGEGDQAVERLIPFVGAYVLDVDLAGRRILVDWGLDY